MYQSLRNSGRIAKENTMFPRNVKSVKLSKQTIRGQTKKILKISNMRVMGILMESDNEVLLKKLLNSYRV